MSLFADRLFDTLASLVQDQPTQLYTLSGREPVDDKTAKLKSLSELSLKAGCYPFLEYVHPSKVIKHLSLCPKDSLGYLIDWIPDSLRQDIIDHTDQNPLKLPSHAFMRSHIIASWSKFIAAVGSCPSLFIPEGYTPSLLSMKEADLTKHIYAMALFSFEPHLKKFIDRTAREKIKASLSSLVDISAFDFIRYIQKHRKDLSSHMPYTFPLHLWDGSPDSFKDICERFGFACLARLLTKEHSDFIEEFNLHVSDAFLSKIPSLKDRVDEDVFDHIRTSFDLYEQYSTHHLSKSSDLKSQREERL